MSANEPLSLERFRAQRKAVEQHEREQAQRIRRAQQSDQDRIKRSMIELGMDQRQPPEYRGRVWDVPSRDGVHPTPFPPMRNEVQGPPTEEFLAFQAHNQTRYETHPSYYCVGCTWRYSARPGGRCGPCIGKDPLGKGVGYPL